MNINFTNINFEKDINLPENIQTLNNDIKKIRHELPALNIVKDINIPVQGGVDPKVLLSDKENIKNQAKRYLDIFRDHPYIFNLGHGILPETNPEMMDYLVKFVKDYK